MSNIPGRTHAEGNPIKYGKATKGRLKTNRSFQTTYR